MKFNDDKEAVEFLIKRGIRFNKSEIQLYGKYDDDIESAADYLCEESDYFIHRFIPPESY